MWAVYQQGSDAEKSCQHVTKLSLHDNEVLESVCNYKIGPFFKLPDSFMLQ